MNKRNILITALLGCFFIHSAANAQSYPPVWNNTSHYVAGDMVTDYGNVYRCIAPVTTPFLDPSKSYQHWELNYVRSGTTILIGNGQPFPTLKSAWTYAQNATIAKGAYLHLNISTAVSPYHDTITGNSFPLNHPFGPNISISGDVAASITFSAGASGFEVDTGYTFGTLSNLTLTGTTGSLMNPNVGLLANGGTFASVGNVAMSGFAGGIEAKNFGIINCASSLNFGQNVGGQVIAQFHGAINLADNQVLTWPGSSPSPGSCLVQEVGGNILAIGCTISGYGYGVNSQETGTIAVPNSDISNCSTVGVFCETAALVDISSAKLSGNTLDVQAYQGGVINAPSATFTNSKVDSANGSYIWGQ